MSTEKTVIIDIFLFLFVLFLYFFSLCYFNIFCVILGVIFM